MCRYACIVFVDSVAEVAESAGLGASENRCGVSFNNFQMRWQSAFKTGLRLGSAPLTKHWGDCCARVPDCPVWDRRAVGNRRPWLASHVAGVFVAATSSSHAAALSLRRLHFDMLGDIPVWHLAAREGSRTSTVLNCALGLECGAASSNAAAPPQR